MRPELFQLYNYNQYVANECQKNTVSKKGNQNYDHREKVLFAKSSATRDQNKKHYHKMSVSTHSDAGGDEELFKTINRAYKQQFLGQRCSTRSLKKFELEEAEKISKDENSH